jgi:hypothetical protein
LAPLIRMQRPCWEGTSFAVILGFVFVDISGVCFH